MGMQEVFSDKDYCRDEMVRIRKAWGDTRNMSESFWEACRSTLAYMYLYAPPELTPMVLSHLSELNTRKTYWILGA